MTNSYGKLVKSLGTKKLIIFGAGGSLKEFVCYYSELLDQTECILDNKYRGDDILELGKKVIRAIPPRMITEYDISKYVVLFCSRYAEEMKEQLDEYIGKNYEYYVYPLLTLDDPTGDKNLIARVVAPVMEVIEKHNVLDKVLGVTGCSSKEIFWQRLINGRLVLIPRLVVVLTERCTLRCKECDNLMRHFKGPKDLDVNVILDSLRKVIGAIDVLPCCELIGGEPFLADSLGTVLDFLLKEENVMRVEITSNGTVLPRQEDIFLLRDSRVIVRLSEYSNIIDQHKFIDYMKENGITLEIMPGGAWIANGSVEKRRRNADKLMQQYDRCFSGKICKTLWEDKLFVCARAASLSALGYTGGEQSLKIGESANLREELGRFLCSPLINACDYCDIESDMEKMTEPAEQMK